MNDKSFEKLIEELNRVYSEKRGMNGICADCGNIVNLQHTCLCRKKEDKHARKYE